MYEVTTYWKYVFKIIIMDIKRNLAQCNICAICDHVMYLSIAIKYCSIIIFILILFNFLSHFLKSIMSEVILIMLANLIQYRQYNEDRSIIRIPLLCTTLYGSQNRHFLGNSE